MEFGKDNFLTLFLSGNRITLLYNLFKIGLSRSIKASKEKKEGMVLDRAGKCGAGTCYSGQPDRLPYCYQPPPTHSSRREAL